MMKQPGIFFILVKSAVNLYCFLTTFPSPTMVFNSLPHHVTLLQAVLVLPPCKDVGNGPLFSVPFPTFPGSKSNSSSMISSILLQRLEGPFPFVVYSSIV